MTLCRGARAVRPTWYIRLPPVSEDTGQYSMPRGRQGQAVSSGFELEPAKVLVRGLPLPRPLRLPRSFSLPGLRPTKGVRQRSTAQRDPWWTGCNWGEHEWGGGRLLLGLYSQPASTALALRSHMHSALLAAKTGDPFRSPGCSFSTSCGPHQ
ncbi:hypothetical protein EDB89DRAFT_1983836, partial [Lactarius sanguifluus]